MKGGSLTYRGNPILINNLTDADLGVFVWTDPDTSVAERRLLFKKHGIELTYNSSTVQVTKSCTVDGAYKSVILKTLAPAPCEDCNYEFGVGIIKRVKKPGVLNPDYYPARWDIDGKIDAIQTPSGGQLADSDKLYIEDYILDQAEVNSQTIPGQRDTLPVDVKRLYLVTVTNTVNEKIEITDEDGTTETITLGATMQATVTAFNANTLGLTAFATGATTLAVFGANYQKFTLDDGGGDDTVSVFDRYLWFVSNDLDSKFELSYDSGEFQLTRFNLTIINNSGSAAGNLIFAVDGTSYTAASSTTSTTFAANICAAGTPDFDDTHGYATALGASTADIYIYSGIYELKLKTLGSAGITVDTLYSGTGIYPELDSDEVFRVFSQMRHLNFLASSVRLEQPAVGSKYCKLIFKAELKAGNHHAASHGDLYEQVVEVYIKTGSFATNLWDSDYFSEGSTYSFVDLLNYWSNGSLGTNLGLPA